MYDWVVGLAGKPYGSFALFALAFAESSFFPIPPDVLLMPLCLGARKKALWLAFLCSLGSVLGGLFGYWLGHVLWWSGPEAYSGLALFFFRHVPGFSMAQFDSVRVLYENYNFWIVFTAGFTPIPFKVITISAGAFSIGLPMFIIASVTSRSARFFLIAGLLSFFGEPIRVFIDRYFNILALAFMALLFGGFVLLKFI